MKSSPPIAKFFLGSILLAAIGFGLSGCASAPARQSDLSPSATRPNAFLAPTAMRVLGDGTLATVPSVAPTPVLPNLPAAEPAAQPTPVTLRVPLLADGDVRPVHEPRPTFQVETARIPTQPFNDADLYLHLPPQAAQRQPLTVLLVLHGMGGSGESFAKPFLSEADNNNWLVVAPNLAYRNHMDPTVIMEDDLLLARMLVDTLDVLPKRLNLELRPNVLVYGFSRGAQLAHRFALFDPERVESVAVIAAGTYTLPTANPKNGSGQPVLVLPYGVADLEKRLGHQLDLEIFRKISFWVAVGEKDNSPIEVPRAFDPYVGTTRVERARAFDESLRSIGVKSQLTIFPNAGHEVTFEMRRGVVKFLQDARTAAQNVKGATPNAKEANPKVR